LKRKEKVQFCPADGGKLAPLGSAHCWLVCTVDGTPLGP
jgi:hypothetical protein